jgi:hypothetical protein
MLLAAMRVPAEEVTGQLSTEILYAACTPAERRP